MLFRIYFVPLLGWLWWCATTGATIPVDPSAEEDGKLNMLQLATKYGYPMEKHSVQTEDGYTLTMYRIPHGRRCGPNGESKVPVLLQHGLLSSSYDYLILGPKKSLVERSRVALYVSPRHKVPTIGRSGEIEPSGRRTTYLLADDCYDVWLGNNRGNSESKKHVKWSPKDKEFWSFSWHEMGKYDIPAMVDHILEATGHPSVHYIGHSQGTTSFFAFAALHPEYHRKIRTMQALSPVVYMKNLSSPLVKVLMHFRKTIEEVAKLIGQYEIFPSETLLNLLGSEICKNKYPDLQGICCNVLFLLCGFDEPQLNKTTLPAIIGHTPAGAGIQQIIHYSQGIHSGEFRQYDFGVAGNLVRYKALVPPKYRLTNIQIPIALYYGGNDFLAAIKDVNRLTKELPNVIETYLVPFSKFNHLDFLFAIDIKVLLYDRVLQVLRAH